MKSFIIAVSVVVLVLAVGLQAQTLSPKPGPELKKLEPWVGEWNIEAVAKDSPSGPEYKFYWTIQFGWIQEGFFLEAHHTWKSKDGETKSLEILWYDPSKELYRSCGFASDGSTWASTATFEHGIFVISATGVNAEGKPTTKERNTFVFSPDQTSFSVKGEEEKDGTWWTSLTGKGIKAKIPSKTQ